MFQIAQEEAAELLGVNAWTVHNRETQGVAKPATQLIPAFVVFLGYDPESVVNTGTQAGRLVTKRRDLGFPRAGRPIDRDCPLHLWRWECGTRIAQEPTGGWWGGLESPAPLFATYSRSRLMDGVRQS
jgi:hypothetical protein